MNCIREYAIRRAKKLRQFKQFLVETMKGEILSAAEDFGMSNRKFCIDDMKNISNDWKDEWNKDQCLTSSELDNLLSHICTYFNDNGFNVSTADKPYIVISFDETSPLKCAGANGCHGDPAISDQTLAMARAHHSVEPVVPADLDGSTVGLSYRFLKGITGIEDSNWEFTVSASDHNQYKGIDRADDSVSAATGISSLCARCHGDFHSDASARSGAGLATGTYGSSVWLRHPVDYDMSNAGEYAGYGGIY